MGKQRRHQTRGRAPRKNAAPFARRLVVMVKVPVAGRVKTRLAREVGSTRATWFYRHTAAAVLARLGRAQRWRTWLAITPDTGVGSRAWPGSAPRFAQGGGDLGQRMQRIMDRRFIGPVVIIGTDIPAVRPQHIAAAFRGLGAHDAVFGPAMDGGYWLVGLRRSLRIARAFAKVRWSSPETLSDTLANLADVRVAHACTLSDVDTAAELGQAAAWCGRRILPIDIGR